MSDIMRKSVNTICEQQGADQPAHPSSLISAYVVRCLDSIIPILAKTPNFKKQANLCSLAGRFESNLAPNPEYRFLRDVAHQWAKGEEQMACVIFVEPNHRLFFLSGVYSKTMNLKRECTFGNWGTNANTHLNHHSSLSLFVALSTFTSLWVPEKEPVNWLTDNHSLLFGKRCLEKIANHMSQ